MAIQKKTVDIVYFSRTGTTRKVSEMLFKELSKRVEVNLIEIKPKRNYPYPIWLFLSFIPHLGVSITCKEVASEIVFLCMPKWTFNCPPITAFLKRADLKRKTVYAAITYGGFDVKRYAENYRQKIENVCDVVEDLILVKRNQIGTREEEIKSWLKKTIKNLNDS